jgi:hypothetical protein
VKILASNHANIHASHRTNVPKYANIHVSTRHLVVDHVNILVSNIIDVNKQFFAIFSFSWFLLRGKNVFIEPPYDYRTPTGFIILILENAKYFTEFRQRGKLSKRDSSRFTRYSVKFRKELFDASYNYWTIMS